MIAFLIDGSGQRIIFTDAVLGHFRKHSQSRIWRTEAGGQLFARFELPDIIVEEATGPRLCDLRTRFSFRPNRAGEQREIDNRHKKGLHFVGDWHTHPEDIPQPSHLDISSMQETVAKSIHNLNAFLMVIVGNKEFPDALSVSLYNGKTIFFLKPEV